MPEATAHESCANILKCKRRPMKKFKRKNIVVNFYKRYRKVYCFAYYFKKVVFFYFVANICLDNTKSDLFIRDVFNIIYQIFFNLRDRFRKIKPFIRRLPFYRSFFE